jgi:sugar phosphate permease
MDESTSADRSGSHDPAPFYAWVIFGILTLSHFLMAMFFFGWGPLAPALKEELLLDNRQLGSVVSAMYLSMMVVSVPAGFLVDRYGARVMLILSGSLVGAAAIVLSAASGFAVLCLVATIGGAGYGMINQVTTKGLMHWFEPSRRGTILGIKQTGVTVGGSLMGLYIPFCSRFLGWQRAVLGLAVALLLIPLLSVLFYRERPERHGGPVPEGARAVAREGGLLRLLLRPLVFALVVLFTVYGACQSCMTTFLVVYAEEAHRLSPLTAGSLLTVALAAGTVSRVFFGWVSDRPMKGDRVAPMAVLALIGVMGLFSLSLLSAGSPLRAIYLVAALLGTSLVGWNALAITLVAEIAGHDRVGSVMGIVFTVSWLGMVAAPPLFGAIVDRHGYEAAWRMVTVLVALTCAGFTAIRMHQRSPSSPR